MRAVSYDLHIHSCLSPCADDDMTPANIVGMASVLGLDVIAITDHNSVKNCEAAMEMGERYGVLVIPGMELCTKEEVHVVCLFETLEGAMQFDSYVYEHMIKQKNHPELFGNQWVYNTIDEKDYEEENLLILATDIPLQQVHSLISPLGGVMIPAHIDRKGNGLIENLGFIPEDSEFHIVEVRNLQEREQLERNHKYLKTCKWITNSDAHRLIDIHEARYFLHVEEKSRKSLIQILQ